MGLPPFSWHPHIIYFFKYSPFKSIIWSLKVLIPLELLHSITPHCCSVQITLEFVFFHKWVYPHFPDNPPIICFFKYSPFKSLIWSLKVLIQSYVLNSTGKHCLYVNILLFLLWGCQTVEWPETRSIYRDTTHEWLTITKVLFALLSSLSSLSLWHHTDIIMTSLHVK